MMLGAGTYTLRRLRRVRPATAFPFTVGMFSGTLITTFLVLALRSIDNESREMLITERFGTPHETKVMPPFPREIQVEKTSHRPSDHYLSLQPKKLVSYNVISSKGAFMTRAFAIHRTWGSSRTKNLGFYLFPPGEEEEMNFAFKRRIPVVSKKGFHQPGDELASDHQGVFRTWKYICEEKAGKYQWHVAVKDTAYLRVEVLEKLLSRLNSSQPLLIGQSITPTSAQRDEYGLKEGENYCMEEGYVVSWGVLDAVCPRISQCQQNAMSENENVEFARCIRRYTHANCTTASEMREFFYHANGVLAQEELQLGQHHLNPATKRAILLSPLKEPDHFYHLHQYYCSRELEDTKIMTTQLRDHMIRTAERGAMTQSLLHSNEHQSPTWTKLGVNSPYLPSKSEDLIHWQSFDDQYEYAEAKFYPSHPISEQVKQDTSKVFEAMALQTSSEVKVDSVLQRLDPQRGVDYFLHVIEKDIDDSYKARFLHALRESEPPRVTFVDEAAYRTTKVNFVVPTPPVSRAFQRFMMSFESGFLARQPPELVGLLVILYSDGSFRNYDKDIFAAVTLLDLYKKKYPHADMRLITTRRPYSRKESMELASIEYPTYELLFLADIHIDFSTQFLERCRMNAHEDQQVYFPAVFSLYHPADYYRQRVRNPYATRFKIGDQYGSWMHESFHLVCVYNYDLIEVLQLGADLKESEWNLLNLFIEYKKLTIFRAMEPGLVHLWQDGCKEEQLGEKEGVLCQRIEGTILQ